MNDYLKVFILLLAVTFSSIASGQLNFKRGYIITNENDTLQGFINDGGAHRNSKVCLFKKTRKEKVIKYHPGEIKAYRMVEDKFYASREIEIKDTPKSVFLEVVVEGKVNLYHHWQNKTMAYYIEKEGNLVGLFNEEGLLRYKPNDDILLLYGPSYILRNRIYLDSLRSLFKDSKVIYDKVEETNYKEVQLSNLTKDYILQVCGAQCINYERDHKMYKPAMGIYAGVRFNQFSFLPNQAYYKHTVKSDQFTSYPVGLFFNFPLHLYSDRLSLQVEITSNQINYQQEFKGEQNFNDTIVEISSRTIGVPVLLKYKFGSHRFSPSLAVGKEFSYGFGSKVRVDNATDLDVLAKNKGGWFGEAGLNYKVARKFSVFANLRVQYNKGLIVKDRYQNSNYSNLVDNKLFLRQYTHSYATLLFGIEF